MLAHGRRVFLVLKSSSTNLDTFLTSEAATLPGGKRKGRHGDMSRAVGRVAIMWPIIVAAPVPVPLREKTLPSILHGM